MRFEPSEQSPCEKCEWENSLLRKRCRNCGANLTLHPDPQIDREVRQDAAEGARSIGGSSV